MIAKPPEPATRCIGRSVEGRGIHVLVEGAGRGTLLIGGLHGDEAATIRLLEDFAARHLGCGRLEPVAVLPLANPDGFGRGSRYNARGVDLNRNCHGHWSAESVEPSGARPWSEPESRALRDFMLSWQPRHVVSLHWALAELDADGGHSRPLAEAMWHAMTPEERRPYRLRVSESSEQDSDPARGYTACPGSLGQWCGYELVYPDGTRPAMVTLELPYHSELENRPEVLPENHLAEMQALWVRDPAGYLHAVTPGVEKMLLAACRAPESS